MSRDYTHYDIACRECGQTGVLSFWSDDWNRWDYEVTGFKGRVYMTGPREETFHCEKCNAPEPTFTRRRE